MTRFSKIATSTFLIIVLTIFITTTAFASREYGPFDWDKLTENGKLKVDATIADATVIMDAHTGKILHQENATEKRYPASITKIMTCMLVLENAQLTDVVTVPELKTVSEKNSRLIGLEEGELLTVEDLLHALMVYSANDAAETLAVHIAGSVADFSVMMNNRATELGMIGTHFVNPHGLHNDNHYTTAMDMAKLAFVAMKDEMFRKLVSTYMYNPPETKKHNPDDNPWPDEWIGTNDLISDREDKVAFNNSKGHAIGVKTGYTKIAGGTLVAAAVSKEGTQEVITVSLNGDKKKKFNEAIIMFEYAFDFYDTLDLAKMLATDKTIPVDVENAKSEQHANIDLLVTPREGGAYLTDVTATIDEIKNAPERFKMVQNIAGTITAPIEQGQVVGTVDFFLDDATIPIMTCDLVAQNVVEAVPESTPTPAVTPNPVPDKSAKDEVGILTYVGYGLIGLVILILIITLISSARRKAAYNKHGNSRGQRSAQRYSGSQRGRGRRR
jgi:D-alanyl-D-alanine carboxypeptidase (penicillin-binding protein 5/6)